MRSKWQAYAAYPQETVLEATALEIRFEFLMHMQGQAFALSIQLLHQGRIMRLYELVEERLLRSMAFVGDVTKGILAW